MAFGALKLHGLIFIIYQQQLKNIVAFQTFKFINRHFILPSCERITRFCYMLIFLGFVKANGSLSVLKHFAGVFQGGLCNGRAAQHARNFLDALFFIKRLDHGDGSAAGNLL